MLITKWVGGVWEELSTKTDMVIRFFIKCGISVPPDGSRDDEINLNGLEELMKEDTFQMKMMLKIQRIIMVNI